MVGGDGKIVALDLAGHVIVVLEGERRPAMAQEALVGGRRFHHAAARGEIAGEHRGRAFGIDRIANRMDDVAQMDFGAGDILSHRLAGHRAACQIEPVPELGHQRAQTAGVEEILHQIFSRRPHIREHRNVARNLVEARHIESDAGPARHGDHVDDGIGRAAHGHMNLDGVVERALRQDPLGGQILPHHLDDAPARGGAHAGMIGIRRRDGGGARQREAERFGDRHHGRRGAHDHASAERARNALLHLGPLLFADVAGLLLGPVFPHVRAGAEMLAAPIAAQHRPRRHIDGRNAHADCTHHQARRGLVAAAEQHRAVDGVAAQKLLRLHGEKIAVEHGRGLDERFGERNRRQLDGKAAGLQHAALDVFGARAQMRVAGIDLAPGIDDADHRPARPVLGVVADLLEARAVPERAQIIDAEPAMAAQILRALASHRGDLVRCGGVRSLSCPAGMSMPGDIAW